MNPHSTDYIVNINVRLGIHMCSVIFWLFYFFMIFSYFRNHGPSWKPILRIPGKKNKKTNPCSCSRYFIFIKERTQRTQNKTQFTMYIYYRSQFFPPHIQCTSIGSSVPSDLLLLVQCTSIEGQFAIQPNCWILCSRHKKENI